MSLTLPILIVLVLILLLVSFLSSEPSRIVKGKITLKELQDLPSSHPPVLVTTIKNGRMEETKCYLASDEAQDEPKIMEIIPDREFLSKCRWFEGRLQSGKRSK